MGEAKVGVAGGEGGRKDFLVEEAWSYRGERPHLEPSFLPFQGSSRYYSCMCPLPGSGGEESCWPQATGLGPE